MKKLLILFSSTDGHTKIIAETIARHLSENYCADIVRIADSQTFPLDHYDLIIIGASIRYGKFKPELYSFIDQHISLLDSKKSAFFGVNAVARKPAKNTPETNPYMQKFLKKTSWIPETQGVFGGKIDYPKYQFIDKYMIRFIMWITNGPTDISQSFEFTNWNDVEAFARKLY